LGIDVQLHLQRQTRSMFYYHIKIIKYMNRKRCCILFVAYVAAACNIKLSRPSAYSSMRTSGRIPRMKAPQCFEFTKIGSEISVRISPVSRMLV
jgi:hypothetical protein